MSSLFATNSHNHDIEDDSTEVLYSNGNTTEQEFQKALQRASLHSDIDNKEENLEYHRPHLYRQYSLQKLVQSEFYNNTEEDMQARMRATQDVLTKLKQAGVRVFVVSFLNTGYDKGKLWNAIRSIIREASAMERKCGCYGPERCLLYQDEKGRLFNLMIQGEFSGLASQWKSDIATFSGLESMAALVMFVRAFGCTADISFTSIRPGSLTFILGLILVEETRLMWLNIAMLVWGMPSVSAFGLTQVVTTDWPRQGLLLILVMATVATDETHSQKVLTLLGISLAVIILLANLGARAWKHANLPPFGYRGPFPITVSSVVAVLTGILIPYMGYRRVQAGGRAAVETVLVSALLVAVIFVVSDFDEVQKFFVVGSETCNQDRVNVGVGIWWAISLFLSLLASKRIQPFLLDASKQVSQQLSQSVLINPLQGESLVEETHDSPVGYRVPMIPDLTIDPVVASYAVTPVPMVLYLALGVVMALGIGGLIVASAYTDWDDNITSSFLYSGV